MMHRRPHTVRDAALIGAVGVGALMCLIALLAGCSTTRTVTIPASEPTVTVAVPDTARAPMLPPPEPIEDVTRPEEVILYDDTATYDLDLSWLEVDRRGEGQTVTLRTERDSKTVEREYALPAFGESLRLQADSQGLTAGVAGQPKDREREATAVEVPWYRQLGRQVRLAVAFFGGVVFGVFAGKLLA